MPTANTKSMKISSAHAELVRLGLVRPLSEAARWCFAAIPGLQIVAAPVRLDAGTITAYGLCTVITLSGDLRASILLGADLPAASAIASAMWGKVIADGDDALIDAIGEMGNLIVGRARRQLCRPTEMSLPKAIVKAPGGQVARGPSIVLPYTLSAYGSAGCFDIALSR